MKPILLIAFASLLATTTIAQKQSKPAEKIIEDSCCCKTEPSCIVDGKKIKTNDIVLDFRSKDIGMPDAIKKIRKGEYVRVKVMNYNPYLYKVMINATDSSVAAPVDLSFLPKFLDPGNLSTFVT